MTRKPKKNINNGVKEIDPDNVGKVRINLSEILDKRKISITMASKRISADYQVVKRYYFNDTSSVDLQVLAKLCCALNCNISDILEYNSLKVDKEGKNFEHTNHINI